MTDIDSQITSGRSTPSIAGATGDPETTWSGPPTSAPSDADTVAALNSAASAGTVQFLWISAVTDPIDPTTYIRKAEDIEAIINGE